MSVCVRACARARAAHARALPRRVFVCVVLCVRIVVSVYVVSASYLGACILAGIVMERERNVDPSGMYTPAPGGGQNKANEYQVISLGAGTAHRPSAEVCVCVYTRNHHARSHHAHIHIHTHAHGRAHTHT